MAMFPTNSSAANGTTTPNVTRVPPAVTRAPLPVTRLCLDVGQEMLERMVDEVMAGSKPHVTALLVLVCVVGTIGNLLVVLVSARRRKQSSATVCLTSLATVDLLICGVFVPLKIYHIHHITHTGPVWCKLNPYFMTAGLLGSTFLLDAIAVDRYRAVCRPLRYCTTRKGRTAAGCAGTVLLGFALSVPNLLGPAELAGLPVGMACQTVSVCLLREGAVHRQAYFVATAAIFFASVLMMVVLYAQIFKRVTASGRSIPGRSSIWAASVASVRPQPDDSSPSPCDSSPCDSSPCDSSPCDSSPCDSSTDEKHSTLAAAREFTNILTSQRKSGCTLMPSQALDSTLTSQRQSGSTVTSRGKVGSCVTSQPKSDRTLTSEQKPRSASMPPKMSGSTLTSQPKSDRPMTSQPKSDMPMTSQPMTSNNTLLLPQTSLTPRRRSAASYTATVHERRISFSIPRLAPPDKNDTPSTFFTTQHQFRVAKLLMLVTMVFMLSWLPYWALTLYMMTNPTWLREQHDVTKKVVDFFQHFYLVNHALNPIIYAFVQKDFRKGLAAMVKFKGGIFRNR